MATQGGGKANSSNSEKPAQRHFYIPGLDGLRAIAVLMVFVAHAGAGNLVPGGFGVTVFFFLSGYLITTLLRGEAIKTGVISLKNFYIRRAFRILPPLYLTLAVAFLLGFLGLLPDRGNWQGLLAALLYATNYYDLIRHFSNLPSGMELIWSLAVEEHFYFIFPLVFAWFVRRKLPVKTQARALATACIVALVWRTVLIFVVHIGIDKPDIWTYNSTDCRFDSILLGCLLAIRNNPLFSDPSAETGEIQRGPRTAGSPGYRAFSGDSQSPLSRDAALHPAEPGTLSDLLLLRRVANLFRCALSGMASPALGGLAVVHNLSVSSCAAQPFLNVHVSRPALEKRYRCADLCLALRMVHAGSRRESCQGMERFSDWR